MPNLDGTGPAGAGPMTGRGMGPCAGVNNRGFCGRGIYCQPCVNCPFFKEEDEEQYLEERLKEIRKAKTSTKSEK